jgi:hypothetical protein
MSRPDGSESRADIVIANTRDWLEKAVIGLNLCPFAKPVYRSARIRFIASDATDPEGLLATLIDEIQLLVSADPDQIETTLVIHPRVLTDFFEYNDFLGVADGALEELDLSSTLQIASFHPRYQFAGSGIDQIENYTNRSPYPMLHLLRQASIDQAVAAFPDPATIYEKNIATLRLLGHEGWKRLGIASPKTDTPQ